MPRLTSIQTRAPTIQDVAQQAQVSAATVSRVLSAPGRVRPETRERVEAAVRATGYTLNQAARSLRLRTSRTILFAAPDIGNPYYSTVVDAVIREAAGRGYGVLVASRLGADGNRWLSDHLVSNRADGILLFDGSLDTRGLRELDRNGGALPLVAAYDEIPDPSVNSVLTDNRQAARRAVEYLYGLGHRDIGHIAGLTRNGLPNERLAGYREAMQGLGLPIRPEWIVDGDYRMESGSRAADTLLDGPGLPSAIFAGNDDMAIGLIHGLRQRGVLCPRDISIIGFDDIPVAPFIDPPLTTMRQPRQALGEAAARTLIDIIEAGTEGRDPIHIVLQNTLVERRSTRAL